MLGAIVIIVGVCSSMIAGVILNKYHKYLLLVRFSAIGSLTMLILALFLF
jgi:hypothetical protein